MYAPFVTACSSPLLVILTLVAPSWAQPEVERDPKIIAAVRDAEIEDGPDVLGDADRAVVAAALDHVANTPTQSVREAARTWLRMRRRELPEFADDPRRVFDARADALDDPDAQRGRPLVLWGRAMAHRVVRESGEPDAATRLHAVRVHAHDHMDEPVDVLLPPGAKVPVIPAAGLPVVCAGYFLKSVTDPIDGEGRSMPVLVAGELTALGDRLDTDLMQTVTMRERPQPEERDAYLTAIAQARMADTEHLRDVARTFRAERIEKTKFTHDPEKFPTFVDLFRNTDWAKGYHGRPVTLKGHVWSISRLPVADTAEEYGFENLYSLLLYDDDGQTIPALVVCTELPDGLPTSGHLQDAIDGISVTGFFYKMQAYTDQQNQGRVVPVIVARSVTWRPVAAPDIVPRFGVVGYTIVTVFLLGFVGVLWWLGAQYRKARRATAAAITPDPTFDEIDTDDTSGPGPLG